MSRRPTLYYEPTGLDTSEERKATDTEWLDRLQAQLDLHNRDMRKLTVWIAAVEGQLQKHEQAIKDIRETLVRLKRAE